MLLAVHSSVMGSTLLTLVVSRLLLAEISLSLTHIGVYRTYFLTPAMLWYRDIWDHLFVSLTSLADGLCALQSPIVWQYQLLNCLRSAAERFLFPVLIHGTNYRKKSPLRHLYLPSNVTPRDFYLGNHFRTLFIAAWHFSGRCGNLIYLGQSKPAPAPSWEAVTCNGGRRINSNACVWRPQIVNKTGSYKPSG